MDLAQPLSTTEFLAVDTETNGYARERCEMTKWARCSSAAASCTTAGRRSSGCAPLSRGIQRFTGITQAMVDGAPPPEAVLPELRAAGCGAASSSRTTRASTGGVLRQAFARAALDWPDPPVLCTVAMARRLAPLQRRRGLARAGRGAGHRGRGDAPRAAGRGDLRARVLRAVQAPVRARGDGGRGDGALRAAPRRPPAAAARSECAARAVAPAAGAPRPARTRPARASTCSATPTGARCTSASR